jgi:thioredoxin 1
MMGLERITDANFEAEVLKASGPVIVYFTTPWCFPCLKLEPLLAQIIATEWAGAVKVGEVNIADSAGMAVQHSVLEAPTLMLFKDGKPVEHITGYQQRATLIETFAPHLS